MNEALPDRQIRLAIYHHFITSGESPSRGDLASQLGLGLAELGEAFERLASDRVIVLNEQSGELSMAMPYAAEPTPFRVICSAVASYANCAWDALGIPAMLGTDAALFSICPLRGEPIELHVENETVRSDDASHLHFAVPARNWWDDIGFT